MAAEKFIVLVLLLGFVALELLIEEKNSALKKKELLIVENEKLLEVKSKDVIVLQNEIDTIQKKGEAEITKAYARVSELERQVEKLEEVLREQKQRHEISELPGSKAENQAKYFSAKNKKVSVKATTAHNQECPDPEAAKTQWSPALKQQWQQAMDSFAPHVETLKTKVNEGYEVSRDTIKPHIVKAQESLSPHVQTVKDLCGPYVEKVVAASQPHIEKVIAASQPHIEKVTEILQPYTKPVRHTYGRFLTTATTYLHQIQTAFQKDENQRNRPTRKDEMHT